MDARALIEAEDPKTFLKSIQSVGWRAKPIDDGVATYAITLYFNGEEQHNVIVVEGKQCAPELEEYLNWLQTRYPYGEVEKHHWIPDYWIHRADLKGLPEEYIRETGKPAFKRSGKTGLRMSTDPNERTEPPGQIWASMPEAESPKGVLRSLGSLDTGSDKAMRHIKAFLADNPSVYAVDFIRATKGIYIELLTLDANQPGFVNIHPYGPFTDEEMREVMRHPAVALVNWSERRPVGEAEDPKRFLQQHGRDLELSYDGTVSYAKALNGPAQQFLDSVELPVTHLQSDGAVAVQPEYWQQFLALAGDAGFTGRWVKEAENPKDFLLRHSPRDYLVTFWLKTKNGEWNPWPRRHVFKLTDPDNAALLRIIKWRYPGALEVRIEKVEPKSRTNWPNRAGLATPPPDMGDEPPHIVVPPVDEAESPKAFLKHHAPRNRRYFDALFNFGAGEGTKAMTFAVPGERLAGVADDDLIGAVEAMAQELLVHKVPRDDWNFFVGVVETEGMNEAEDPKDFLMNIAPRRPIPIQRSVRVTVRLRADGSYVTRRVPVLWEKGLVMDAKGWKAGINLFHSGTPRMPGISEEEWESHLATIAYHIMEGPSEEKGYLEYEDPDDGGSISELEWTYLGRYKDDQATVTEFFGGVIPHRRDESEDPKQVLRAASSAAKRDWVVCYLLGGVKTKRIVGHQASAEEAQAEFSSLTKGTVLWVRPYRAPGTKK